MVPTGLKTERALTPAIQGLDWDIGNNFISGGSGGLVYLPWGLYEATKGLETSLQREGYCLEEFMAVVPQTLNVEEVAELRSRLDKYTQFVPSEIAKMLLGESDEKLANYFCKLNLSRKHDLKKSKALVHERFPSYLRIAKRTYLTLAFKPPRSKAADLSRESLYDPQRSHDQCGIALGGNKNGKSCSSIPQLAVEVLRRNCHRGGVSVDGTPNGFGVSLYGTDEFFIKQFPQKNLVAGEFAILPVALPQNRLHQADVTAILQTCLEKVGLTISEARIVPRNMDVLRYSARQQKDELKQFLVIKPQQLNRGEFDLALTRAGLAFEMLMQKMTEKIDARPHMLSASAYFVIYKELVTEFARHFLDFADPTFTASAFVTHVRQFTGQPPDKYTGKKNTQVLDGLSHNGDITSMRLLVENLIHDPIFREQIGGVDIDLQGYSDSAVTSILIRCLRLMGHDLQTIVDMLVQPYSPGKDMPIYDYFNVVGKIWPKAHVRF